jgi:hypothetical protein
MHGLDSPGFMKQCIAVRAAVAAGGKLDQIQLAALRHAEGLDSEDLQQQQQVQHRTAGESSGAFSHLKNWLFGTAKVDGAHHKGDVHYDPINTKDAGHDKLAREHASLLQSLAVPPALASGWEEEKHQPYASYAYTTALALAQAIKLPYGITLGSHVHVDDQQLTSLKVQR